MKIKEVILENTAIHLRGLPRFFKKEDPLVKYVPERATHTFALHPDKWESTFYSLTNKDPRKLNYYRPTDVEITADTLVADMAIANKFYRAKTEEEKLEFAKLYKDSLKPLNSVDISTYRMPELLIPNTHVNEQAEMINVGKKVVDVDGIKLNVSGDGASIDVIAMSGDGGKQLGYVIFDRDGNTLVPDDLAVDERYRGQGIAKIMYDYIKSIGFTIKRSFDQTSAGKYFWDKNRGEEGIVWESKPSGYLYHGTIKNVSAFYPFSHFGTIGAATDRLDHLNDGSNYDKMNIYQVKLNIKNPANLGRDINDNHSLKDYVKGLLSSEIISSEEVKSISDLKQLIDLIKSKGYDGLFYYNGTEDPGSISYVIFDPSQVKVIDVMNLSTKEGYNKMVRLRKKNPSSRMFENGGYVPVNSKEAKDPRFSMALSVDIKPGEIKRQAAKMGLKTDAAGRPPLLRK